MLTLNTFTRVRWCSNVCVSDFITCKYLINVTHPVFSVLRPDRGSICSAVILLTGVRGRQQHLAQMPFGFLIVRSRGNSLNPSLLFNTVCLKPRGCDPPIYELKRKRAVMSYVTNYVYWKIISKIFLSLLIWACFFFLNNWSEGVLTSENSCSADVKAHYFPVLCFVRYAEHPQL